MKIADWVRRIVRIGSDVQKPIQRVSLREPKPHSGWIECSDCKKPGHIDIYFPGDCAMPPGWVLTWHWLRPLYICPDCCEKRRKLWGRIMSG